MVSEVEKPAAPQEKAKILFISAQPSPLLEWLPSALILEGYEVTLSSEGEEALQGIEDNLPHLILLDTFLPYTNSFELCSWLKNRDKTRRIPVLLLLPQENFVGIAAKAFEAGADDFLQKPISRLELLTRVRYLLRSRQEAEPADRWPILLALARAVEARDPYTHGHTQRVILYALALGQAVGLSREDLEMIRRGAIVHDVGKIGLKESLLFNPGSLNPEEWEQMKAHPLIGEEICLPLKEKGKVLTIIRHHHERWDSKGYPDGLSGEAIPILARIVAIADAYDALTSERPYRRRYSPEEALEILHQEMGKQFDPALTQAFIKVIREGWQLNPKDT